MSFKKYMFPAMLTLMSFSSYSASLQQQLSAVAQAESEGKQQEQMLLDAQQEKRDREVRAEQQRKMRVESARMAADKKREAARQEANRQRFAEQKADKVREQSYEDTLRSLDVEKRKLDLERETARVKRENDFIDQELKEKSAKTDVIQSEADAARNLSTGGKELMQSEGRAKEKKASGWFN